MSKQRPSTPATGSTPVDRTEASTSRSASYWQRRVFKNTYTRAGRCIEVKGWSVKIQHEGARRTFSLHARSRAAAAAEAEALYRTIIAQGWDAIRTASRSREAAGHSRAAFVEETFEKTDLRYWKPRLLRRQHAFPAGSTAGGQLSARIEYAGASHYFPLGTSNDEAAAAKAREIYLTVVRDGWELANQRFRRELTAAIRWAENPLAWSYATFYTAIDNDPVSPSPIPLQSSRPVNVGLVESDTGARRALSHCINGQSGFLCAASFGGGRDALRNLTRSLNLVLVSRALPDVAPEEFTEGLRRVTPNLPVFFFNLYEDSDHLFKATPGGASGYLLKRTPPDRLFEPIADALNDPTLTVERIALHVRRYFQNVIASLSADDSARDMAKLTHREHDILNLLSKGYVDKEIADTLGISVWTVHGHLKKVFEKLGVHTRTEAAVKYLHK